MIGERLLDLRKDAGLTQDELAGVLNINKHSISSNERDKSEPPDIIKIAMAEFFGVSVDYLVGVTDNPSPYKEPRNYIRLPAKFTEAEIDEILNYVEFVLYKRLDAKAKLKEAERR